jgi:DNA-binding NarL/FixJ family response regulator
METAKAEAAGKSPTATRVWALIDERPLTRLSFERLLKCSGRDFTLMAFAGDAELLDGDGQPRRDLQLMIYRLPTGSIADPECRSTILRLVEKCPGIPLVVLGERNGMADAQQALNLGARGYITTSLDPCLVVEALRMVRSGGVFIPPQALIEFAELPRSSETAVISRSGDGAVDPILDIALTFREVEVMREIAKGMSNKGIARTLNIQEGTVKVYVRQLMKKLKAANRTQVALMARQWYQDHEPDPQP